MTRASRSPIPNEPPVAVEAAGPVPDGKPKKSKKKAGRNLAEIDAANRRRFANSAEVVRQAINASTEDRIKAGEELLKVRKELGHGQFLRWLKSEFDFTPRTAENYMLVATFVNGNTNRVSYLGYSLLLKLAKKGADDAIVQKFVASLSAGNPLSAAAVNKLINDEQQERREQQRHEREDVETYWHERQQDKARQERVTGRSEAMEVAKIVLALPKRKRRIVGDYMKGVDPLLAEILHEGEIQIEMFGEFDPSTVLTDRGSDDPVEG